jgi:DNA-binding transcriptional regulator YiaG
LTSDDKQAIRALRDAHAAWREIEAAALDATAHLRGERQRREYVVTVPDTVDVAGLRAALGLSQGAFGRRFGISDRNEDPICPRGCRRAWPKFACL